MSNDTAAPPSLDIAIAEDVLGRIGLDRLMRALEAIDAATGRIEEAGAALDTLWVPFRGTLSPLPVDEIRRVEAHRDYVKLHDRDRSYMVRATISSVAAQLGDRFVRIHRSSLIARSQVTGVRHTGKGRWVVVIEGRHEVPVGRSYLKEVRDLLRHPPL